MATTTNFGWETPDDTDLVKDGAAAIRTSLNGVDSSFADLKGGTTGQVLSKASGTDLDFTWVAQDDSNAIQNAIVDAKGDLIAATAADTPARLAVGTNGQVLTADSTAATGLKWASPSQKIIQVIQATYSTSTTVATTTLTDTGLSATITPTSSTSKILIFVNQAMYMTRSAGDFGMGLAILRGSTNVFAPAPNYVENLFINLGTGVTNAGMILPMTYLDSPATTSATTYKIQGRPQVTSGSGSVTFQWNSGISTITLMEVSA